MGAYRLLVCRERKRKWKATIHGLRFGVQGREKNMEDTILG